MANPGPATTVTPTYVGGGNPATVGTGQTSGVVSPQSVPGTQSASLYNATGAGSIIKYQTAIIPFAVPATTAAQNTSSVSSTLQLGYQFATNSVYVVNKPTQQAGLGIGGVTCATSKIINVNYINVSSAAITPTGEANDVIEFRPNPLVTSASLSPTNVPINTTVEQIFTLPTIATAPIICLPGSIDMVNQLTRHACSASSPYTRAVGFISLGVA